ncbi:hypothetical protein [Pelagicoccus sp. SDUM812002]|uniref:hypothetical protein n=1 Tax=Pelagicoccus sp. SDUM812002 TaxID=3041266 RepID=UPI00280DB190|nr:hypothetical protein [Pelagicoccus sp. SDUM812002]MDQ8186218.1 hypothetical protein [Pelagicoccus sp. SDUM812002]
MRNVTTSALIAFSLLRLLLLSSLAFSTSLFADSLSEDRLLSYTEKCHALRDEAAQTGHVCYQQVLGAAYGTSAPLADFLNSTMDWQTKNRAEYSFFADYRNTDLPSALCEVPAERNQKLGSTLIGRYDPRKDAISIASIANGHAVAHESGHALQRKALLQRRDWHAQSARFDPLHALLQTHAAGFTRNSRSARRLRYLSSQDELEVRLQDLNRLHATAFGTGPIFTPLEALRALAFLDLPLSETAVQAALQGSPWELSTSQAAAFLADLSQPHNPGAWADAFEDAYELKRLYRLIKQLDPSLWEPTLKKILFEAPGHL